VAKNREMTYSQALHELEKIVAEIESEEVEIDLLAEKIKRASDLISLCRRKLKAADEEVKKVLSAMDEKTVDDAGQSSNDIFSNDIF